MATPEGNGLVSINGKPQKERGFFCMQLVAYLDEEAEMGTEFYEVLWHERFEAAKRGECPYRDKCPIYKRTVEKYQNPY
ncbi:MAG: hypothetical protein NC421_07470 [Lachnospiraceae bacterium]|nr:hypothetical protein [Lachnospiraceae bacterium]